MQSVCCQNSYAQALLLCVKEPPRFSTGLQMLGCNMWVNNVIAVQFVNLCHLQMTCPVLVVPIYLLHPALQHCGYKDFRIPRGLVCCSMQVLQ